MIDMTLLYFDGCPNWRRVDADLRALGDELALRIAHREISSPEEAERVGFLGSPTILVDGRDPFAQGDEPVGLACRVYQTPDGPSGAPSRAQLRAALG